jgi:predicted ArsR family transcriptional regulator
VTEADPERRRGRRAEVLSLMRAAGGAMSIVEIADRLEVHPNTVRFHLDSLVSSGQVVRVEVPPRGPGRPPQLFQAHPGMDPAGPRNYRFLAGVLTDSLAHGPDPIGQATAAGEAWGRRMAEERGLRVRPPRPQALAALVELLDEVGFAPEEAPPERRREIGLRRCPFLELVDSREVVCAIHLGVMRGAMEAIDATVTVTRLQPFEQPDRCLAHLGVRH